MPRPPKVAYDLKEKLAKIKSAGLSLPGVPQEQSGKPDDPAAGQEELLSLNDRIRSILQLVKDPAKNQYDMLYLVMYDIEDNQVRTHIAKYLLSKGCIRIQKSVYLARTHQRVFQEISDTLREVQQAYDNQDSILLVPVQANTVGSMKIIGKDIQIQTLIDPPNTLFY